MTPTLDSIDAQVAARSLLQHPFYQAWSRGELPAAALRDYAAQYYHHVSAFPTYLSAVHAQCDDLVVRRQILNNLIDEEAGTPNHPALWMQFAASLGLSEDEVEVTPAWPETRQLIDAFRAACGSRGVAAGTAALYAYESQIPAVAQSKIDGLTQFYGITGPEALAYFTVHERADREHASVERQLLASMLKQNNTDGVTESVDSILTALNEMLSGVCRRHSIQ